MSLGRACCRVPLKSLSLSPVVRTRGGRPPISRGLLSDTDHSFGEQRTILTRAAARHEGCRENYWLASYHKGLAGFQSTRGPGASRGFSHAMAIDGGKPGEAGGGNKPKLTINIVSDTMCPWCFVGKKHLEKAMALSKDKYDFEVVWRPYQLNPDAPKEGMNKRNYYRQKFGEDKTKMIIERMTEVFKGLGYEYSMDGLVGNSLDSHRLLEFAKGQNLQNEVCEELFLNSFVRAKYNGHIDNLVEAAEKVGITGSREFLEDPDAGLAQVREDLRTFAKGVRGVPHFIVNGQVELVGAQPPSALLEAFEDAVSAVA